MTKIATAASPQTFNIYLSSDTPIAGAAVLIERDADHFLYDNGGDKTFKADGTLTNPYIALVSDVGSCIGRQVAQVVLDPSQFVDGDYIINFMLPDVPGRPIFDMSLFSVFGGNASTPVPLTVDKIVSAVVAALPTTSGGSAPTAAQNAIAFLGAQYKAVTGAGTVSNLLAAIYAAALAVPAAGQNAQSVLNAQYKAATAPGTVGACLNAIQTSTASLSGLQGAVVGLQTRMNNVSSSLTFVNNSLAALSTNQHNNLAAVNAALASITAQLKALSTQVAALQTKVVSTTT